MSVRRRTRPVRAIWTPSFLRRLLRHRVLWAVLTVMLCTASLTLQINRLAAVETERSNWSETARVVVVRDPVAAGDVVAEAIERVEVPRALIPPNVVIAISPEARAKVELFPGEILLTDRVTNSGKRTLPDGTVALTVSIVARVPLMEPGDLVDLWAVDSANFSSQRVASNVVLLAVSDDDITIAVPQDQAASATAASLRPLTVTLIG